MNPYYVATQSTVAILMFGATALGTGWVIGAAVLAVAVWLIGVLG